MGPDPHPRRLFFHLMSFPLGTALGVYSFVILLNEETVKLFARP